MMVKRIVALLGVALAVWSAAAPPASASPVDRQAWVRSGAVPTFVPQSGRMYVATDVGRESARSFVRVDVSRLPEGVGAGLVLQLGEDGAGASSALADGAAMVACPLTSPLVADGELSADAAPTADCSSPVTAVRAADGSWSVPLDAFVARWRTGTNLGLALVPSAGGATTFRLSFDTTKTSVALPAAPVTSNSAPSEPGVLPAPAPLAEEGSPAATTASPAVAAPSETAAATAAATDHGRRDGNAAATSRPGLALGPVHVASPPAGVALVLTGAGALCVAVPLSRRRPRLRAEGVPVPARAIRLGSAALALVVLPTFLAEATVYKLGLVLIVVVGAMGLHLLVNWAGELSLAHVTLIGLPAFVVAKLSADHGLSPVVLLPLGVAAGLLAGLAVGIPAMRARGLQVALVTLAAAVAIDRFFFTKTWLVGGAGGAQVDVPRLGPVTFTTSRSLYPVLAVIVLLTVLGTWAFYRSKLGRGLLWVKAQPEAAAAFGIPVGRYRTLAHTLAGGFAGLAGGLTAMWVQRLTPQAFPLGRSFTFLIIVALAGRGFVGGVAAAAAVVEGGRLFFDSADALLTYGAPAGLILTLTRHQAGLNGLGRQLGDQLRSLRGGTHVSRTTTTDEPTSRRLAVRPLLAGGLVAVAVGFAAIVLAWYHAGNTSQVWVQNQELISGGLGGLGLVIVGVALVVYDRVLAVRAADAERWERLLSAVEAGLISPDETVVPRQRRAKSA